MSAWCKLAVLVLVPLALAPAATAQNVGVPSELLEFNRRQQGDQVTFCLDPNSVGAPFDRKVAEAIADTLLLTPVFADLPSGFSLDGAGYFEELQIAMTNTCDVGMGFSEVPNSPFPDWATFSRPYAQIPFVLAVTNPDYRSLADIPRDRTLGTAIGSLGEYAFITYNQQLPEAERWRRLPYADPRLLLTRLIDGTLGGAILWGPSLSRTLADMPDAPEIHVIPTDPVPQAKVSLGALLPVRDAFLRSQVDEAIGALIADGTIARLLEEAGFSRGMPAP